MDKRCENCSHFHAVPGGPVEQPGGECRKRSPVIGPGGAWQSQDCAPYAYWPVVSWNQWCGDFRPSNVARKRASKSG